MSKNLRFCFKVDKSVGLAEEAFICIKVSNAKSYQVPSEEYKDMQDGLRRITAYQMQCDSELLTPITLNEYLDNTEED